MTDSATGYHRDAAVYAPPTEGHDQYMASARAALAAGDDAGAEAAFRAAVTFAQEIPERAPALAAALGRLGEFCHQRGREDEAVDLLQRAFEINQRVLGAEHPDLVVLLNDLSRLYLKRGAHAAAEPLLLHLHAIKRKKGEDHPEVATVLASLASVRQALGRHDSAEQLWRRVLEIRRRTLAPNHFTIATTLEHLAETCAARGKLGEALRLMQQALATRELTLDPGHASLRTARERIADLQLQASDEELDGEPEDAAPASLAWPQTSASTMMTTATGPLMGGIARMAPPAAPAIAPMAQTTGPLAPGIAAMAPALVPTAPAIAPVAPAVVPTAPAAVPLVPAQPTFVDCQLGRPEDELDARSLPDAGALRLVTVGGPGEIPRSLILPHYAEALSLADEQPADAALPRKGIGAALTAVNGRRVALATGFGAAALVLGTLGVRSIGGAAESGSLASQRPSVRMDSANGALSASGVGTGTVPTADSSVAMGAVQRGVTSETARSAGRQDAEERVAPNADRPAPLAREGTASNTAATAALPRSINLRIDAPAAPAAASSPMLGALAPTVSLPAGGSLRTAVPREQSGAAQPALLISAPTPQYPVALYTKGVAGTVTAEFTVDTTGLPIPSTFKGSANHELFTEAVQRIVPDMRFVPSTEGGRKVRTVVRMRFQFQTSGVISSRPI